MKAETLLIALSVSTKSSGFSSDIFGGYVEIPSAGIFGALGTTIYAQTLDSSENIYIGHMAVSVPQLALINELHSEWPYERATRLRVFNPLFFKLI